MLRSASRPRGDLGSAAGGERVCRKKLGGPVTLQLFNAFAEALKKEKSKENVAEGNRASLPSWTKCEPQYYSSSETRAHSRA